jgi:O-antigen/teichoic acid export membrane protein
LERKKPNQSNSHFLNQLRSFLLEEVQLVKDSGKLLASRIGIILLTLALTPIISRLYSPADYGHFSIYSTLIQVLVTIGTLGYPLAIISAKVSPALSLKRSIRTILLFGFLFIVLAFFTSQLAISGANFQFFRQHWFLIPMGFVFAAILLTLRSLFQRHKAFAQLARNNAAGSTAAKTFNIILGLSGLTVIGLILSDILSRLLGAMLLFRKMPKLEEGKSSGLHELKRYPKIVMPSELLSLLSTYIIIWYLAYAYSLNELGKYWLAFGLTSMILHSLSNTLQPVITQRVRESLNQEKPFNYKALITGLFILSASVFIVLVIIPGGLYEYYLGNSWNGVGNYIKLIAGWYIFLLVDQVLENSFFVLQKEKMAFWLNGLDIFTQLILLLIAFQNSFNLYVFIGLFVGVKVFVSITRIIATIINLRAVRQ